MEGYFHKRTERKRGKVEHLNFLGVKMRVSANWGEMELSLDDVCGVHKYVSGTTAHCTSKGHLSSLAISIHLVFCRQQRSSQPPLCLGCSKMNIIFLEKLRWSTTKLALIFRFILSNSSLLGQNICSLPLNVGFTRIYSA